jgi:hypothetical protein
MPTASSPLSPGFEVTISRQFLGWLTRQGRRRPIQCASRLGYRPRFDNLEERITPTLFKVTASAGAQNTFTTLSQAVTSAQAGDTIEILAGANPGSATVTQDHLTIVGDPVGGWVGLQAAGTVVHSITLLGNNDVVNSIFVGSVNIGIGAYGQTIANCLLNGQGVTQTFGSSSHSDGGNTVLGCTFFGGANVTLGNSGGSPSDTSANDNISNNVIWNPTLYAVQVQNETSGLVIANNRITHTDPNTGLAFIEATDCTGSIAGNTISFYAAAGATGILANDNPQGTGATSLSIVNNVVTSNQTGISVQHLSTTDSFTVSVTNNSLAGNLVGLGLTGNAGYAGNDYGTLTIAGNDFRNYSGVGSNFAIAANDGSGSSTAKIVTTVTAQNNIFSSNKAPATVVSAATSTTIDVSNGLTGSVASLTAMFLTLGGGPPLSTQLSADTKLTVAAQAVAAVTSSQAEATFVGNLYVSLLGRVGGAAEIRAWVNLMSNGTLDEEQVLAGFLDSTEFYTKVTMGSANPTRAWIQALYVNLLGRQAGSAEINAWLSIEPALGLGGVAEGFINSAEFRGRQVAAFYGAGAGVIYAPDILKRVVPPSAAEISAWDGTGLTLRVIEAEILASGEFALHG